MSKFLDNDASILSSSIEENVDISKPGLSELFEKDKVWDKHRYSADLVANHYRREPDFEKYAQRIDTCAQLLDFRLVSSVGLGLELKLSGASFCRVPRCPICQWRRSLKWKGKTLRALPLIVSDYPKHRWLFFTLTQENCLVTNLRNTITNMNKSFLRLTRFKKWSVDGWIKSLEVTLGKDGNAHPHFHCVLMVPSSYFGLDYINRDEWAGLWQRAARLDYKPQVYIRAVSKHQNPVILIPEILKYSLKESDLYKSKEFLLEVTRQLYKMRCISVGGVLRQYLRKIKEESEDLISINELKTQSEFNEGDLYFEWKYQEKKYNIAQTNDNTYPYDNNKKKAKISP